jgi:Ferritin-like
MSDSNRSLKASAFSRLQWKPLVTARHFRADILAGDGILAPMFEETDPFLRAYLDEGLSPPSIPGAATPREEFIGLLQAAAEIEHALMVQYLYAWFTSGPKNARIDVFQEIAVQEMGHLFSVQNLLRALGEPVHLFLPSPTSSSAQNTFPFPMHLGTASRATLAQYVTAESPLAGTLTGDVQKQARVAAHEAQIDVRHVGLLFLKLYWLAQPSSASAGPWQPPLSPRWAAELGDRHVVFAPPDIGAQRSWNSEWDVSMDASDFLQQSTPKQLFVARIANNPGVPTWEQVCRVFYSIGAQGEGYVDDPNVKSHFESFLELYNNWDGEARSVIPTAPNPWIGLESSDPARESSRLSDPDAVILATAFNLRYERILLLIALTFAPKVNNQPLLEKIRQEAIRDMRRNLVSLAGKLLERPAKVAGDQNSLRAGPTFQSSEIPVSFNDIRARLIALKANTAGIQWPSGIVLVNAELDQPLLDLLPRQQNLWVSGGSGSFPRL